MGKKEFIIRRLVMMGICFWIIMTILFILFRMLPGDPTITLVDPTASAEERKIVLTHHGLDKPLITQYFTYMKNLLRGNFGRSFFYRKPVIDVIGDKFWNTIILMFVAFIIAYGGGFLGGMILAWKRGTALETIGILTSLAFRSAPVFWTGMLAIVFLSHKLGWFPFSGMRSIGYAADTLFQKFWSLDFLWHLFLPAMVSSLYFMGLPLLLLRNSMLEVIHEDYIEIARAKDLSEFIVMIKHGARNAILPIVTDAALFIGWAIGGQVLVEYVFSWPGLGREIVMATLRHDYPLAQAAFFIIASMVTFMNFVADIVYGYLDPRIVYK
jgi:peptide/nickel transport system permease protein